MKPSDRMSLRSLRDEKNDERIFLMSFAYRYFNIVFRAGFLRSIGGLHIVGGIYSVCVWVGVGGSYSVEGFPFSVGSFLHLELVAS